MWVHSEGPPPPARENRYFADAEWGPWGGWVGGPLGAYYPRGQLQFVEMLKLGFVDILNSKFSRGGDVWLRF